MSMANRIQSLRKSKGLSQEELAGKIGVSRQAVSKWESEQSAPDLEKVVMMSDFFGVTTDYILKGIEPMPDKGQKDKNLTSRILYILSTAFILIGLFCAFGGWYAKQTIETIWVSMIIQMVGVAGYFISGILSDEKAPFFVKWLNILGIAFMPVSMITGFILDSVFKTEGWAAPYPVGIFHILIFTFVFSIIVITSCIFLKRQVK